MRILWKTFHARFTLNTDATPTKVWINLRLLARALASTFSWTANYWTTRKVCTNSERNTKSVFFSSSRAVSNICTNSWTVVILSYAQISIYKNKEKLCSAVEIFLTRFVQWRVWKTPLGTLFLLRTSYKSKHLLFVDYINYKIFSLVTIPEVKIQIDSLLIEELK